MRSQHVPSDSVQPRPGLTVAEVITAPGRKRPHPDLAEQVVGDLVPGPPREVAVNGDLVPLHNLGEGFGTPPQRSPDQHAVWLHVSARRRPLRRWPSHRQAGVRPVDDDAPAAGGR